MRIYLKSTIIFGICSLLFFSLLSSVLAQSLLVPNGFVNDFAEILSVPDESSLTKMLQSISDKYGPEIAVVTVKSLEERDIESFSLDLARRWGIGSEGKDDGLLILIAPNERAIRLEVGYGLEGHITDAQSSWLIKNEMAPKFRQNYYGPGIRNALMKIEQSLEGLEPIPSDASEDGFNFFYFVFMTFWFFFPLLGAWLGRSKKIWPGGLLGFGIGGVGLLIFAFAWWWIIVAGIGGLIFDWIASNSKGGRGGGWWWLGGGRGGSDGDSFGGFSGGSFGGGGASGSW
jgi:uncharacterized protein